MCFFLPVFAMDLSWLTLSEFRSSPDSQLLPFLLSFLVSLLFPIHHLLSWNFAKGPLSIVPVMCYFSVSLDEYVRTAP
jgi:hypothetical protein